MCGCLCVCVCVCTRSSVGGALPLLLARRRRHRLTNIGPPSRTNRSPRAPLGAAVDPNILKGCGAAERSHLRAALLPCAGFVDQACATGTADRRCCAVQAVSGSRCAKRPAVACPARVSPPLCCHQLWLLRRGCCNHRQRGRGGEQNNVSLCAYPDRSENEPSAALRHFCSITL